jgi:hypothetical protein
MFERVLRVAQALRGLLFGLTVDQLNHEISGQTGHSWHVRTLHRDLALLEYLGVVERRGERWRWCAAGSLFDQRAEAVGQAVDWHSRRLRGPVQFGDDTLAASQPQQTNPAALC